MVVDFYNPCAIIQVPLLLINVFFFCADSLFFCFCFTNTFPYKSAMYKIETNANSIFTITHFHIEALNA